LNGGAFTGPALKDEAQKNKMKLVQEGKVGSLLNVIGTKETRAIQEAATKSRLKIPLLFGLDVIHGYKTIFPIKPNAQIRFSSSFSQFFLIVISAVINAGIQNLF
jgi:beta-glucosidase-like glycosyl hydrolase